MDSPGPNGEDQGQRPVPSKGHDAVPADHGPNWVNRMNSLWGYLVKEDIAPIFIGECGDWLATPDSQA